MAVAPVGDGNEVLSFNPQLYSDIFSCVCKCVSIKHIKSKSNPGTAGRLRASLHLAPPHTLELVFLLLEYKLMYSS